MKHGKLLAATLLIASMLLPLLGPLANAKLVIGRDTPYFTYNTTVLTLSSWEPRAVKESGPGVIVVNGPPVMALDELVEKGLVEPSRFIVIYGTGVAGDRGLLEKVRAEAEKAGVRIARSLDKLGMDVVEVPGAKGAEAYRILERLYARLGVEAKVYPVLRLWVASINTTVIPTPEPSTTIINGVNDPLAERQWGLWFIGVEDAWRYTTGLPSIVVAVIDTGAYYHPDLVANLWFNPGEIPFNGVDDDGNGYVDDVVGYDFADQDPYPYDTIGHGTLVAGIIAATTNNTIGVAGVAPGVKVMVLKAAPDNAPYLPIDAILDAINYVVTMKERGVDIVAVSASWGALLVGDPGLVLEYTRPLYDAILTLWQHGILFVAAAGNNAVFTDDDPAFFIPAEYDLPNIVSVGAIDSDGRLAYFSNHGYRSVDLLAPGVNITSTYAVIGPTSSFLGYAYGAGTSFATPHVTGVAALIASLYELTGVEPGNRATALRMALLFTATKPAGTPLRLYSAAGYLNASTALAAVAADPGQVRALLLEPSPLPGEGVSREFYSLLVDTVPAGVPLLFRVLAGSLEGPRSLTVEVYDEDTGRLLAVLSDNGKNPDRFAGDGVYTGEVVVPLNASNLGGVDERRIAVRVYEGGSLVYEETYLLKVYNTPATYKARVSESFVWLEPPVEAMKTYYAPNEVVGATDAIAVPAPSEVFGADPAAWQGLWLASYPSWMIKFTSTATGFIGDPVNPTGAFYAYASLASPGSIAGVGAVLAPFTASTVGFESSYGDYVTVFRTQMPDGQLATVYMAKTKYWAYNADEGTWEAYPVLYEAIFLENGTILLSYRGIDVSPLLEAGDSPRAYIAFNRYLYTLVDLTGLASMGKLDSVTIVLEKQPTITPAVMEWGVATASHIPTRVDFVNSYANPVVVVGPPTYKGYQPAVSYVQSVDPAGFTVRVREWDYLDGSHVYEDIGYLVVEAGAHVLSDGRILQAGYATATTSQWVWVEFPIPYPSTVKPVVVASIASETSVTVTVRIRDVSNKGFWVLLQTQESLRNRIVVTARIAWVAVEPGASDVLEAGNATIPKGSLSSVTITFANTYPQPPVVLASITSFNGGDTASLRLEEATTTTATIVLQEEQSADQEIWHVAETISYIVFPPG